MIKDAIWTWKHTGFYNVSFGCGLLVFSWPVFFSWPCFKEADLCPAFGTLVQDAQTVQYHIRCATSPVKHSDYNNQKQVSEV